MNRSTLYLARAVAMVGTLITGAEAVAATIRTSLTVPVVDINNPCTAGNDSIDGSLEVKAAAQVGSDGVTWLTIKATGSGVDYNGVGYTLAGSAKFQFHDPLPASVVIKLKMTSASSGDNARLVLALHVNEQGSITKAQYTGVECLG